MKIITVFCMIGCMSVSIVSGQNDEPVLNVDLKAWGDLLTTVLRATQAFVNQPDSHKDKGAYEVADDGSIAFIHPRGVSTEGAAPAEATSTPSSVSEDDLTTSVPATSQPDLSDDESVNNNGAESTLWEFVPRRVHMRDPLGDSEEFPLLDQNEIEDKPRDEKLHKFYLLQRRRRDVKVDVGGSGGGSSGIVDVAVNKPGSNVAVNVGGIQDFLSQLGIHFNGKPSGNGAHATSSGGNVDVNVGGKPGHNSNVDVNVNKPNKGQTNVAVDWASFIPFVKVGVNKKGGASNVGVDVGQNGGSGSYAAGSLVDVQVEGSKPVEGGSKDHKRVVVKAPFVDLNIDGDFPPPPPPHHHPHHPHPPKKHHPRAHDAEDKNVAVNVGGQNGGSWWPFVNVNVDSDAKAQPKSTGKKCININVPFVNVLLNRGCTPDAGAHAEGDKNVSVNVGASAGAVAA